jgi:myo-inositol-1(or 4)-monophosphatase
VVAQLVERLPSKEKVASSILVRRSDKLRPSDSMHSSDQILTLVKNVAMQAGQLVCDNFRRGDQYQEKDSHADIVTESDFSSQQLIHEEVIAGMRDLGIAPETIGFIEEENSNDVLQYNNFIVDPIDGTTNFASGLPYSCISIAYAIGDVVNFGVVYEPFSETMYWGEKSKGSFLTNKRHGERRLQLKSKPIDQWLVSAHLNGPDVIEDQFTSYQRIYPKVRGMRNIGSLTLDLCMMADNVFDVVLNRGCYIWDLAAAQLLLREAGGELYRLNGEVCEFDWDETQKKYDVIACHPDNINEVMSLT